MAQDDMAAKIRQAVATISVPVPGMRRELSLDRILASALQQYAPGASPEAVREALLDRIMSYVQGAVDQTEDLRQRLEAAERAAARRGTVALTAKEIRYLDTLYRHGMKPAELSKSLGLELGLVREVLGLRPLRKAAPARRRQLSLD